VVAADEQPSDEEIRRFDKARNKKKKKRVSNDDWQSPTDPDSRITRMKDGRTHLAYKAEHVVDLKCDLLLAAEIRPANEGDSQTMVDSVMEAQVNLDAIKSTLRIEEVVADKGYHAAGALELCDYLGVRTYIPEPSRKDNRTWTDKSPEQERAVRENRRRVKRAKSKQLQRARSERCERTFAHVCDSGGMRRSWLRGLVDVTKRYVLAAAAHNLGRILFKLFGIGKPRSLQGSGLLAALAQLLAALAAVLRRMEFGQRFAGWNSEFTPPGNRVAEKWVFPTGC
jgi:transposase